MEKGDCRWAFDECGDQGKACFAELQDSEGRIQLYLNRDVLCPKMIKPCTIKYSKN
jgi:lysyl-tRNA synthetase class II